MDNTIEEEESLGTPLQNDDNNSKITVTVDSFEDPCTTDGHCVSESALDTNELRPCSAGGELQQPHLAVSGVESGGGSFFGGDYDSLADLVDSIADGGDVELQLPISAEVVGEGDFFGGGEKLEVVNADEFHALDAVESAGVDEYEEPMEEEQVEEVDRKGDMIVEVDETGIRDDVGEVKTDLADVEVDREVGDVDEMGILEVVDASKEIGTSEDKFGSGELDESAIPQGKEVSGGGKESGIPSDEYVSQAVEEREIHEMCDSSEKNEISDMEEEPEEEEVAEEIRNVEVSNIGDVSEEVESEEDEPEEEEVAEEIRNVEVSNIGDVSEEVEFEEEVQEAEETDMTEEAEYLDTQEERQICDWDEGTNLHDTTMSDVAEEMEETETETQETMVTDIAEGMEMAEDTAEGEEAEEEEAEEEEEEIEEASRSSSGKRKRGKNARAPATKPSARKKRVEEDVCFICFDGGELVLCDRRGCPKAYHPSCVGRDEAFFRAKGKWNCGWHLCSKCEKNAHYMCYTCTFSLCKGCIKDGVIFCVRGTKGFCETCLDTVSMIEKNQQEKKEAEKIDFDDKTSWEFLFKDYWTDLKDRLSITSEELAQAKNPWKGSYLHANKLESPDELYDANNDGGSDSDSSSPNVQAVAKRRKSRRRLKSSTKARALPRKAAAAGTKGVSADENAEWASKELLEVIMHMRNGDKSFLPRSEVHTLLLDYIKKNNLRDPRRKSQVICDSKLQNLFGKPHVGHFEMLNLLDSHFLVKESTLLDDLQESVLDTETNHLAVDESSDVIVKTSKDKKRKTRKKGDNRGYQSNLDDYAAIDMHNINLIYMRRNLVEDLIGETETFRDKAVGSFVRIRICNSGQKQDLYRLVQVLGTGKAAEPYKVGKRTTEFVLEILNLDKTEMVSIDIISNQEFTEDECKRLRQSIKCGFINRLTVGDIQDKAMTLQEVRVKDWLETETMRLSHLRDRASEKGRRKELRECVEKLQLLKSPEERQRRLEEIPEIHVDSNMDPTYVSEEDEKETGDKKQDNYLRPRSSNFSRRGRDPISPRKGSFGSSNTWSGTRNYSSNQEPSRSMSKGFSNKKDDIVGSGEILNGNLRNSGRDKETHTTNSLEIGASNHNLESSFRDVAEISPPPPSTVVAETPDQINETDKIWHYKDPSGKVQGPFSVVQLRKWSNTGYFPTDLKIWKTTEKQEDSTVLTDALAGKFHKHPSLVEKSKSQIGLEGQAVETLKFDQNRASWSPQGVLGSSGQPAGQSWKSKPDTNTISASRTAASSLEIPKYSQEPWSSDTNLPSPTPNQVTPTKGRTFESKWSPTTPVQRSASHSVSNQFSGGIGAGQQGSQLTNNSTPPSSLRMSGGLNNSTMGHGVSSAGAPPQMHSQPMTIPSPTPGSGSQVFNTGPSQTLPGHPAPYGRWIDTTQSGQNSVPSFAPGNPVGVFPTQNQPNFLPSDSWRLPGQANGPWGMANTDNQNVPRPMSGNPNMGWAGTLTAGANMNWGPSGPGPAQGNSNPGWIAPNNQVQAHGIANPGWVAPGQGQAPGWIPPGQGPPPVNGNPGWAASNQGQQQPHGNPNLGWAAPSGNQGFGANEQNHHGSQRDRGSQGGGDSGYNGGGGKSWNRQSSFGSGGGGSGGGSGGGGGSSRTPFRGGQQRVCVFHENGHCKKGAACDYMHN